MYVYMLLGMYVRTYICMYVWKYVCNVCVYIQYVFGNDRFHFPAGEAFGQFGGPNTE